MSVLSDLGLHRLATLACNRRLAAIENLQLLALVVAERAAGLCDLHVGHGGGFHSLILKSEPCEEGILILVTPSMLKLLLDLLREAVVRQRLSFVIYEQR